MDFIPPTPASNKQFAIYRGVIDQLMRGEVKLPSLPAITLKLRQAMSNPNTTNNQLVNLIVRDPSMAAQIMKTANCALYRRMSPAKTLSDAVRLLGRETVEQLVMQHSVKSLFVMKNPALKKLFAMSWQRQATKTAICVLLTQCTGFRPPFLPVTGGFLSEVGTLAVLSAFNNDALVPDSPTFITLCREYSKSLGVILLKRWQVDVEFVDMVRNAGNWQAPKAETISALEIVNLALYHSLVLFSHADNLPPLDEIPAFQNLPEKYRQLDDRGLLPLISQHAEAIEDYTNSMR